MNVTLCSMGSNHIAGIVQNDSTRLVDYLKQKLKLKR